MLRSVERHSLVDGGLFGRRRVLGAGLAASLALLNGRVAAGSEATPAAGGSRTVETIWGPVTVPENPQRIVAVSFVSAMALLDLGITPVGITRYMPTLPAGYPDLADVAVIEDADYQIDLEKVLSLEPDLIVGSDWLDPEDRQQPYQELAGIAPTAFFEWQQAGGNWAVEAAGVAEALGKAADMTAMQAAYEQHAKSVRETYADVFAAGPWDLIDANDSSWFLYGPSSSHGRVAAAAGVTFGGAATQTDGYVEESFERFDLLAQTRVLLVPLWDGVSGAAPLDNVAPFQALPAVRNGHVFTSEFFFPASYGLSEALLADIEAVAKQL